MGRAQRADIDIELLSFRGHRPCIEQARCVGIGRADHHARRSGDQWRALAGVDRFDRIALRLLLGNHIFPAIGHDRSLARSKLPGGFRRGLNLQNFLLCEFFEPFPAEIAAELLCRRHDGAGITGMGLDDLAHPFGIEQVGVALGRILGLHQLGVVSDDRQGHAPRGEHAVGVLVGRGEIPGDVFGDIGREQTLALPHHQMRGVRTIHDIANINLARILLADALEVALRARSLHAHGDARIFGLERLGDLLGDRQVDRGIPCDLAFLLGGVDEFRCDLLRLGWRGAHRRDEAAGRQAGRGGNKLPPRETFVH